MGIGGTYTIFLSKPHNVKNPELLSPVTLQAMWYGHHGPSTFQCNGCQESCRHSKGNVVVCHVVGTMHEASCHCPVMEWGSSATCWGTQSPWLSILPRKTICRLFAAHGCEHNNFFTCTFVSQHFPRFFYTPYASSVFVHFPTHPFHAPEHVATKVVPVKFIVFTQCLQKLQFVQLERKSLLQDLPHCRPWNLKLLTCMTHGLPQAAKKTFTNMSDSLCWCMYNSCWLCFTKPKHILCILWTTVTLYFDYLTNKLQPSCLHAKQWKQMKLDDIIHILIYISQ